MRLEEIETRLAAIKLEAENDGADVAALSAEADKLLNERKGIMETAEMRKSLISKVIENEKEGVKPMIENEKRVYTRDSAEYRSAWLNAARGLPLNAEERDAMNSTTASAGHAIPTITENLIIKNMVQIAPMIGEINLLHIEGYVKLPVEGTRNAAALHAENAAITPASDTITYIQLNGYECVKTLAISAKLQTMSIDAFEGWIVDNISRSLAELIENYIINGTGSSQPKGIDYAETWTDTTNAVDFAAATPTVAELEELIGLVNPAYANGMKFLMNWKTFWNNVHVLRDEKNPEIIGGTMGNWYIFGVPVVLSSKVADGDIFLGNFREGVVGNMAAPVTIESDASAGFTTNSTVFRGACLFDCTTVSGRIVKGANTL